jgi:hypothetical protein
VVNLKGLHTLWDIPFKQKAVTEYNNLWQPVEMYVMKFRRITSNLIKAKILLDYGKTGGKYRSIPRKIYETP